MRNAIIFIIAACSAFIVVTSTLNFVHRRHAENEWRRQEQQVASWEREQFEESIQKAARTCAAVRVRCSALWLVLEGQITPGGPWVELGRMRAIVYEGENDLHRP